MARINKSTGKSSSFGKRSKAEDDFHKKSKSRSGRGEAPKRSGTSRFSAGARPTSGARFRPKPDSDGGDFRDKKPQGRNKGEGASSERPSRFAGGPKKSFGRSSSREDAERPKRFSKREGSSSKRDGGFKGERKSFVQARIDNQREYPTPPSYKKEKSESDSGLIRLNKFIANSGVCSRREADELIKMGLIAVNGVTITEMGYKVKPTDDVRHEGKKLKAERPVYVLLNKPKGFITTTDDPQERNTVMGLVASACKERIYPVGRLDRNTTGLLLLTNDGDLTDKLTHPSYNAKKIYKVELDRPLTKADFQRIVDGEIRLEEGKVVVDDIAIVSDDGKTVGIEIHIGWNRIVRRLFEAMEYEVVKLDRVAYAGLDKKDLKRGQWRFLKPEEVIRLKHFK